MTNQSTMDKLIEMRLTTMADAFRNQLNDPKFKEVPFEDQFGMLVDIEYSNRKSNSLKRLIRNAGFDQPEAYIGDINFNHVVGHVLSFIYVILSYVTANSPETQAPSQKVSMGTVPNFFIFSTGNFARIMYNGERTLLSRRRN